MSKAISIAVVSLFAVALSMSAEARVNQKPIVATKKIDKASPKLMMKRSATKPIVTEKTRVQSNSPQNATGSSSVSGDISTHDQLYLQQMMEEKSQLEGTISNVMKQQSDTQKNIIENMK